MAKRKRRSRSELVAAATMREIKAKKLAFLREVSSLLSDALGFRVRVSLVGSAVELSPDQRRAARLTKAQARRQMADSMLAPVSPGGVPRPSLATLDRVEEDDGSVTYWIPEAE